MSQSDPSKVFLHDAADPDMQRARDDARRTFRYFWRELAWERRRIIPGLDVACVKAPFSDGGPPARSGNRPAVEEMWISDIDFDGRAVTGKLLNRPNWLTSVREGDAVRLPLDRISDWMYVIAGEVFGAHTVQLMRARMDRAQRAQHDQAWGLNFGDPATVRLVPEPKRPAGLKGLFTKPRPDAALHGDHPMSINMGPSLKEQVRQDPSFLTAHDDRGWTTLHDLALAGSSTGVRILLEAGADPRSRTADGRTPADLARSLGWDDVVALLEAR